MQGMTAKRKVWNGAAKRLRELRESRGLTQEDVGRALGIGQNQISRIESGSSTSLDRLVALAKLYGATTDYVILGVAECTGHAA